LKSDAQFVFQALVVLLATTVLAQEEANSNDQIRRLRFRRPRPKVVGISNEEGVAQGRPIPLRQGKTYSRVSKFFAIFYLLPPPPPPLTHT
jgi:hypothetical protein